MTIVNIHAAKTHLSRLVARVRQGEEIVIAKAGKPLVRIIPIEERPTNRVPGIDRGKGWIADDFDAPLPEDLQAYFE
jgi:prevent-host-death family protein